MSETTASTEPIADVEPIEEPADPIVSMIDNEATSGPTISGNGVFNNSALSYRFKSPSAESFSAAGIESGTPMQMSTELVSFGEETNPLLAIAPIETSQTDPATWWKQQEDMALGKPKTCFIEKPMSSYVTMFGGVDAQIAFPEGSILLDNLSSTGPEECTQPRQMNFILVLHKGVIIGIGYGKNQVADDVLSTLEFY